MDEPSAPPPHLRRGVAGERAVGDHLQRLGHQILERNWRGRGGEIDLITRCDGVLHFVEVKTRSDSETTGGLWETVPASKRGKLARAAEAYLLDAPDFDACVFSVALVRPVDGAFQIEFLADAFDSPR